MEMNPPNAVVLPEIGPQSMEFGGMTNIEKIEVYPMGNLLSFLPPFKGQSSVYFDTWGCVGHSLAKGCRAYLKARYNQDYNFADRDLIVLSGTKPGVGNSGNRVIATAQQKSLVPFEFEDWDMKDRDPKNTRERYYAYARVPEAQPEADKFNAENEIWGEWVGRERWQEASRYGSLQLYVNAWYKDDNGEYYNPNGKYTHAVLLARYSTKQISDTYEPELKILRSWDDAYYWALKITINKKTMSKPTIANNTLVQLVRKEGEPKQPGDGQFGLYLDNKILTGETGALSLTFYMRNNGDTKGKTLPLTREQWNMFEKKSL